VGTEFVEDIFPGPEFVANLKEIFLKPVLEGLNVTLSSPRESGFFFDISFHALRRDSLSEMILSADVERMIERLAACGENFGCRRHSLWRCLSSTKQCRTLFAVAFASC